jgi:hypothetical protein
MPSEERLDETEAIECLNRALLSSPLRVAVLDRRREPQGLEAHLEHMLEHQIMRKQEQVDFLRRALGG